MSDKYTLVEFFKTTQVAENGKRYWEEGSTDIEGNLMVFDTVDGAAGMARFILGADGEGDEREPRPEYVPLIGILWHDGDPTAEDFGGEAASWGWVDIDGVLHEGDYENDPKEWDDNPIQPAPTSTSDEERVRGHMTRVLLVHLNVEVPSTDTRSADEIADAILAAFQVGYEGGNVGTMTVECPLAEEV